MMIDPSSANIKVMLTHYQKCYWLLVDIKNNMLKDASEEVENNVKTRHEDNIKNNHPTSQNEKQ